MRELPGGGVETQDVWAPAGYRVEKAIGQGGFATVYEAVQLSLGRSVALKVLMADLASESHRRRFDTERQILTRLGENPHVVDILDAGISPDGRPFIVMRLYQAGSLAARVAGTTEPLPIAEAVGIVGKVASALDAAHALGILHRDIKPENILLTDEGEPVLSDFGISAVLDADPDSTRRRSTRYATPGHSAPEVLDQWKTSVASDVYSLASTTYNLLTGRCPFEAGDLRALVRILTEAPPPLGRPDVPPALEAALLRGLAKDPQDRPASAGAFAASLQAALDGRPAVDAVPLPRPQTPVPPAAVPPTDRPTVPAAHLATQVPPAAETPAAVPSVPPALDRPSRRTPIMIAGAAAAVVAVVALVAVLQQNQPAASTTSASADAAPRTTATQSAAAEGTTPAERMMPAESLAVASNTTDVQIPGLSPRGVINLGERTGLNIAFQPGTDLLAVPVAHGEIAVWSTRSPKLMRTFKHLLGNSNSYITFSPDGERLLGSGTGVTEWKAAGGSPGAVVQANALPERYTGKVAVGGGGSFAVAPTGDAGMLRWWNIDRHAAVGSVDLGDKVRKVLVTPDGRTVLALTRARIAILDMGAGAWGARPAATRSIDFPAESAGSVFDFDVSPDGKTIAVGDPAGLVQFWDLATGTVTGAISGLKLRSTSEIGPPRHLTFSPDGKRLAMEASNLTIWDVASKKPQYLIELPLMSTDLAFSPDGHTLAVFTDEHQTTGATVQLWTVP